jgi:hypothetical protein
MNPLLIKYGIIALALIGWTTGVYFYATNHEARIWKTAIAEQKVEAEKILAEAYASKARQEQADADKAREVDSVYQAMVNDAYAGRDAFADKLRSARRGQSCGSASTGQAADPSISPSVAGVSDDGSRESDPASRLRDSVLELQRYAKACHSWALSVGR